jgi:hypothetical protein
MATVKHVTIYPVVEVNPSNPRVIANFNAKDWGAVVLGGFSGYSWGWMTGVECFDIFFEMFMFKF